MSNNSQSPQLPPTPNNRLSLYVVKLFLEVGGQELPPELMKQVLEVCVEESLHLPTMFTLRIYNTYGQAKELSETWLNQQYFKIGDRISIGYAASTTEDPNFKNPAKEQSLFQGEITAIAADFTEELTAHIVVRGYDVSHRLHRGRYNRSFTNSTDSDIVEKIAKESGIEYFLERSKETHDYVFQENQTNMEFLRERAARIGFELFVQDNILEFRQPKKNAVLQLKWLTDIKSFSVRATNAQEVNSVEVRSWDYSQKKLIKETAETKQVVTTMDNSNESSTRTAFTAFKTKTPPKMIVVDQPVSNEKEANKMAQALCNELGGEFICADAKAVGNPNIRPGKVVELKGMGDIFSGNYYVTETRHIYSEGNYRTEFSIRGLREGNLLSTLAPQVHLQPGQTLMVGIVTNNYDDKGLGRVKVQLPTLSQEHESHWARVVGLGAGYNRGFYCLPEVDDEVLVGFEHGDIHRPYIIGGVWNGKDKTVEPVEQTINQQGKVRLRTIKTRTGHTIQFVEEDSNSSKAGIYITTSGGQEAHFNDSKNSVIIKTKWGQKLTLDDTCGTGPTVTLQTLGGTSVTLNEVGGVSIKTSCGVSITASSNINMTAPMITMAAVPATSMAAALANPMAAAAAAPTSITMTPLSTLIKSPKITMIGTATANNHPI